MKKKLRLKKPFLIILKLLGTIIIFIIGLFVLYRYQIHDLKKLGYSDVASKNILFSLKKNYVLSIGKNELLNKAFESSDYKEENLDSYSKIKYCDQKNIIKNINTLIARGYSNNNISIILEHGSDSDVSEFAKRDKVKYLEEFYSISYAKLSYYDRYVTFSSETGEDEEVTVLFVNLGMDKEAYVEYTEVNKFSYDMLVNKYYKMNKDLVASDLVKINSDYTNGDEQYASKKAVDALYEMFDAAEKEGYGLIVNSSYRSYEKQEELCEDFKALYGDNYVKNYVAQPGFSEHQTGLAFDIGSRSSNIFANSKEYKWINENAHKYGFILRFSKSGENITGFRNEPWHYRYVGKKIADYIYDNKITFEEYYVKFLDQN